MKQVVQSAGGGPIAVIEAPAPQMSTASVLVATSATLISAGTERAVTQLAQASLIQKARARPDLVKQVLAKAKTDGLQPTIHAVRSKLADDLALGYSGAGTILEVGSAVRGFAPGDRVATGGGGFASHAEFQAVPWVLASKIPDNVSDESASFCTVASVGLHGLRQADMRIGSKIVIVGLGLIGQMTARMAVAAGCDVLGIDLDSRLIKMAEAHGIRGVVEAGSATTSEILDWSRGRGADAVIVTAGAQGNSGIIRSVPERCRDRATVVAVGDIGLDINRNDFYMKELDLKLARSYGPGRYDRSYEEWGVDYPVDHVRWTEGRNLEAVLDLMGSGKLDVSDLISHRFDISEANAAYETLEDRSQNAIGIVLTYPGLESVERTVSIQTSNVRRPSKTAPNVGILGAGNFVRGVIVPSLKEAGYGPVVHIASASGVSATRLAEREGIAKASSDPSAVINDPDVDVVVVATPHSTHAEFTAAALRAGKDVYCEKPLALSWEELADVEAALEESEGRLYVGFNRRYAPMIVAARDALKGSGPVQIQYRVNASALAPGHWYSDRREGGRLLGEVCHFVDTCNYLAGDQEVTSVHALGPGTDEHDSYHVFIGYADGSSASVVYCADADPATPKERIEVNGRGHTVVVDNFRVLTVDGSKIKSAQGKGHAEGMAEFLSAENASSAVETMQTALIAKAVLSNM